jgi:uncharacterized OB-fold protein
MSDSIASSPLAKPFVEGLLRRRLMFQRCDACARAQTLARYACQFCGSEALSWDESKGKGKVHSVTQVGRAPTDSFKALVPYTLAIVLLDEGFKLMGHAESSVGIDDEVVTHFVEMLDQVLVRFQKR